MGCDLCGKDAQLYQTRIEGTILTVCEKCASHGEIVRRVPTQKDVKVASRAKAKEPAPESTGSETILLVREGYGKLIKAAREKSGMNQEDFAKKLRIKESQLHKYETGVHKPDLETARMLEKALRITLVEEHVEKHGASGAGRANGPLTIGDMLKTK